MISNKKIKQKIISKYIDFNSTKTTNLKQLIEKNKIGDGDWILSKDMCEYSNNKLIQLGSIGYGIYIRKGFKYISDDKFDELKCSEISKGDLLINRFITNNTMTCCIVSINEKRLLTSVDVCWIKEDQNKYLNKYLMYCFLSDEFQEKVLSLSSGTTRIRISKSNLSKIDFPIPPIEEQKRIVKKIEELFELIDKKEKNDKEKEKLKEVLKSKVLEEKLLIGDIAIHKLSDFLEKTHNVNWKDTTKEFCYIDLSSVDRQKHIIEKTSIIDYNNAPSRAKQIVKKNDVLFGTTRPLLGRVCIVDEKYDNQICSTGFCVMRPKKDLLNSKFLEFIIRSSEFIKYIEPLQRGVSYPAVSDKDVYNYEIPIPPLEQQKKIVEKIEECFKLIEQL